MSTVTRAAIIEKAPWCAPIPQRNTGCCIQTTTPPQRPDLATYSQMEQIANGNAPTWNSPDITTNNDFPWTLLPAAQVVVRNLSNVASAINALVTVATSAFGIGMPQSPLSSQKLSLGPGQQVTLSFPFTAALLAGPPSIGTYVLIEDTYDANRINNSGGQVVQGMKTSDVGRNVVLSFPVTNSSGSARTISLNVLANALSGAVTPAIQAFAPWEQINASLNLSVPGGMHGTSAAPIYNEVTVIAYGSDGSVVGGATWILWVDN
ncbi:MAG: hypothetical protein ABSG69_01990 [Candidatus Acidiferrum sp.]|jgi:hypothetical protein